MSTIVETTKSDANGRYQFPGYWTVDRYTIFAEANGYTKGQSKVTIPTVSGEHKIPDIKLGRMNLAITGRIVNADGQPIAAAEVVSAGGQKNILTKSQNDGTFTLTGLMPGRSFIVARKVGYYARAVAVQPGVDNDVKVALSKQDSPPVERLTLTPEYRKAQEALARQLLTRMWESDAKSGFGTTAITRMATLDIELAKKWRDAEKERTGGRQDYTPYLTKAGSDKKLIDQATKDLDEAFATIAMLKPAAAYNEYQLLGKHFLATDKAKALRCAEEAVVQARQVALPAKMFYMASAGSLAFNAGGKSGVAVIKEAAALASSATFKPNTREGMYVGIVAAYLAPHDWPKAETLLSLFTDANDYNRYLSDAAWLLAKTDLPRAKALLTRFKPSGSFYQHGAPIRVALAIADTNPDDALKIVDAITEHSHRVIGHIQLAKKWGVTDRQRAYRAIDTAFDLLEKNPDAMRAWSGMGGSASCAILGVVRANEIGYPNIPSLIARTLAMMPTLDEARTQVYRDRTIVKVSAILALLDPVTARQLLSTAKTPEEILKQDQAESRDWLFAVALCDPVIGRQLVDKLMDRTFGKDAPVAGGSTSKAYLLGISELSSILTAKDPFVELKQWMSILSEIEEDQL